MSKVTPFLMFNDQLEAAIDFYMNTFPDSRIIHTSRSGKEGPLQAAELIVAGQRFKAFNGGPSFSFTDGLSLFVDCADQAEVDGYWEKFIAAGGSPIQCGWIRDPFGLSWQIVPRRFTELIGDSDPRKVQAVVAAMMKMEKLDVVTLEAAWAGA